MCISTREEWGGRLFTLVVRFDCGMCDGGVLSRSAIGGRNSPTISRIPGVSQLLDRKTVDKVKNKSKQLDFEPNYCVIRSRFFQSNNNFYHCRLYRAAGYVTNRKRSRKSTMLSFKFI